MTKDEIIKLMNQQEKIYERNYRNYQDTGISRYERVYQKADDIADLCRRVLNTADEHDALLDLRSVLMEYGSKAIRLSHAWDEKEAYEMIKNLAAASRLRGVEDRWR